MVRWSGTRATLAGHLARLVASALLAALPGLALATTTAPAASAQARAAGLSPVAQVTIIVLDMSGSMGGSNGSDPQGLRCSAANAYISLSGPNQFIGVVGLADPSGSGKAQIWAQPAEMATQPARQQLIQTIAAQSHHCAASGYTPTFDALSKAYDMLAAATRGGRAGSVILLTDGVPEPNQDQQTNDIIHQLVPKFNQAGFPIDTIALGNDPSVRPFLRNVSSGTNGSFDDDVNPSTGQPDPLQIAPVFLRYFAALTGRTPKSLVSQQPLNGGVTQRDFSISSLVQHLDVVVIKQDAPATVSLRSPEGIQYTATTSSVLVALDPHYAIFSIDGPTPGDWVVSVTGGSQAFSVYGLVVTNLHIALTQPGGTRQAFPIDQPLAVQALLTSGNVDVNGDYTVTGKLSSGSQVIQQIILTHTPGSATYSGSIGLPPGQASGTYDLTFYVTQGSGDVLTSSPPRAINFEIFPTPFLLDAHGAQSANVSTTVVAYDWLLQHLYSLPVIGWFSGLPLNNIPATPSAVVNGVVTLHGQVYQNAAVSGSATRAGQKGSAEASVTDTGSGHFQVIFPAATAGQYTLALNTSGAYKDSHGAFGATQRQVTLTIRPATAADEGRAWGVTAGYALILVLLSPLIYRWFLPRRRGAWTMSGAGARTRAGRESGNFYARAVRGENLRWWFKPNTVTSNKVWGFPGLLLSWNGSGSQVTPHGRDAGLWTLPKGRGVAGEFTYKMDERTSVTFDVAGEGSGRRSSFERAEKPRGGRGFGGRDSGRDSGRGGDTFGRPGSRQTAPSGSRGFGRSTGAARTAGGRSGGGSSSSRGFGRPR